MTATELSDHLIKVEHMTTKERFKKLAGLLNEQFEEDVIQRWMPTFRKAGFDGGGLDDNTLDLHYVDPDLIRRLGQATLEFLKEKGLDGSPDNMSDDLEEIVGPSD